MKILVIGDKNRGLEIRQKFTDLFSYEFMESIHPTSLVNADFVFDFLIEESPQHLSDYAEYNNPLFLSVAKSSLRRVGLFHEIRPNWFGFNGLPGFINRNLLEVSLHREDQQLSLNKTCEKLNSDFTLVDDRVGMVTPRVICMIINEAYYTNEEGTASRDDIDKAMKLGTNYPYGPFEWCKIIGITHVYELLLAVYEDTKDERYQICPSLKKEYLDALSIG